MTTDERNWLDAGKLGALEVRQAIRNRCRQLGLQLHYQRDELRWWKTHPADLVAFEEDGKIYAYHRRIVRR